MRLKYDNKGDNGNYQILNNAWRQVSLKCKDKMSLKEK